MVLLAVVNDLFFWNICFCKGFIFIPEEAERHLGLLLNALQIFFMLVYHIFFMLVYHKRKDERYDQCSPRILAHNAVHNWKDRRCSERNKSNVIGYDCYYDLSGKHNEEHSTVKRKDHTAKAGKPFTSLEIHVERKDVSENTSHAGNRKRICKLGK